MRLSGDAANGSAHVKRRLTGLVKRGLRHAAGDRSHPIEKLVLRSAGLARQPADGQIDDLTAAVTLQLGPLLGAAMAGNVHALRKLTELAATLCAESTAAACLHPDAADRVARERESWPLNLSHEPEERRRALRLLTGPRRLPLGNRVPPAGAERKAGGFSHPACAAVLVALKAIEVERSYRIPSELFPTLQPNWSAAASRLPELQASTADAWFKVIWLYVCERYGGAPEASALRRLVGTGEAPQGAAAAEVRSRLRGVLEQAFLRLMAGRGRRGRRAPTDAP